MSIENNTTDNTGQAAAYADLPALITAREAAGILNVHPRTVARMCEQGKIKAVKVMSTWRVNSAALLEFAGLN